MSTTIQLNNQKLIFGHPSGLYVLFFVEMWERFSYYGMRAILTLFLAAPVIMGDPQSSPFIPLGLFKIPIYSYSYRKLRSTPMRKNNLVLDRNPKLPIFRPTERSYFKCYRTFIYSQELRLWSQWCGLMAKTPAGAPAVP